MSDQKEQRQEERFSVSAEVACTFASPVLEDFGPVRIKNISNTGIGLVASEAVQVGLLLAVKLTNPVKKFAKTLLVRVIHVTPQAGGTYLVGGALDAPLSYEELCNFVM